MAAPGYKQNIVIDFEFTPLPKGKRINGLKSEIIEIGAVRIDDKGNTIDSFQCLVKPEFSDYVAKRIICLTGITNRIISDALSFEQALTNLAFWVSDEPRTRFVAWSDNDKRQLKNECRVKEIDIPSNFRRWMDLQTVFPYLMKIKGGRKRLSLEDVAKIIGITVDSSEEHRALYDATITAELFSMLLTGEYEEHKSIVQSVMKSEKDTSIPLSTSIGSMNSVLSGLYDRMVAQEAAEKC